MKRKRNGSIGGVDWISDLPECIIHQIMSRLSSKEVARTCVSSKTWYHHKRNYPVLDFNLPCASEKENFDYLFKIRQTVYNTLHHFKWNKLALQTFSLRKVILGKPNLSSYLVDNWILLAVENGVNELHLCAEVRGRFFARRPPSLYSLPQPVFCSKTLTILELTLCALDLPLSMLSSLRKLDLSKCVLKGPINLMDTDCPVLEEMSIQSCVGENFKSICITGLLRLHTIVVSTETRKFLKVEISSQSVQSLALLSKHWAPWSDINIHGCARLKRLYLVFSKITDAELHSLLLNVPLLEELYLFDCCNLKIIQISSLQLKTLEICSEFGVRCCELIEVSAPNLENFIYKSHRCVMLTDIAIRIEVADCCRSLKTLVLCEPLLADEAFHNLISRFPLLENMWLASCIMLQNLKVPNIQLKRLYIVDCSGLEGVEVGSPSLSEVCFTGPKVPEFSVANASGSRGKGVVHSSSSYSFLRLKELLEFSVHPVKDEFIFNLIVNVGVVPFER